MHRLIKSNSPRFVIGLALVIASTCVGHAQTARDRASNNDSTDSGYSDSDAPRRARTTTARRNANDRHTTTDESEPSQRRTSATHRR